MPSAAQIARLFELHQGASRAEAWARTIEMLKLVGISEPERRARQYAHQLSGGMCQRVMIAMALATSPRLLIADEPTTGLDVSIAAQILDLLRDLGRRTGASILLITHDLGVVAEVCDRVAVMHAGQIVEVGPATTIFARPLHPYTQALVRSIPRIDRERGDGADSRHGAVAPGAAARLPVRRALPPRARRLPPRTGRRCVPPPRITRSPATPSRWTMPLLAVEDLVKHFPLGGPAAWLDRVRGRAPRAVRAVDGVSFTVEPGETLGLVGESGCGKSTVARLILRLVEPTAGRVRFGDVDLTALGDEPLRRQRRDLQMVFQDPTASLNPRLSVRRAVEEPLRRHGALSAAERRERVVQVLARVGLGPELLDRYPHELSGGQRQRVNIARAIATEPRFVVLDEPTSALDVSLRARAILLLAELRATLGMSYLFISHDLATVKYLAEPRRRHVPGDDRGGGADGRAVPVARATPTRGRSCRPFPSPIPRSGASASGSAARSRARSTSRQAAGCAGAVPLAQPSAPSP